MIDAELSALMVSDRDGFFDTVRKDTTINELKGRFTAERQPHFHTATLADGSKITIKFVDTIKFLLDSKMKKIYGRDSWLSYLEIIATPAGAKAFTRVFDVKQVIQGVDKTKSYAKHQTNLWKLIALGELLGIDLSQQNAWSRNYVESYKDMR